MWALVAKLVATLEKLGSARQPLTYRFSLRFYATGLLPIPFFHQCARKERAGGAEAPWEEVGSVNATPMKGTHAIIAKIRQRIKNHGQK
jgi:hypothetical protein